MKTLTIDEAFDEIGHLGRSQLLYFLGLASLQFFTCNQMLLNAFQGRFYFQFVLGDGRVVDFFKSCGSSYNVQ